MCEEEKVVSDEETCEECDEPVEEVIEGEEVAEEATEEESTEEEETVNE